MTPEPFKGIGMALATRLGLAINKTEGHDLMGPCIACHSSDAFRLHQDEGVAQCYSCGGKWSPFHLAEKVLNNREQAKSLMVEMGIFQPSGNGKDQVSAALPLPDPIQAIARQKGISPESLIIYGAKVITPFTVRLPAFGPDGTQCTHFDLNIRGGKGKFAAGKPAGLFFPHENDKVRLPQPGETWHIVEGCKDAAALHGLGVLACGLNTCRLAAKFARLFKAVDVILIPDRDSAGEEGSQHSARVLRNVAKSIRIATLPAEHKESGGDDVRDILRRAGGRDLVLQSIADAQPVQNQECQSSDGENKDVSGEVQLPEGDPLTLTISPAFGKQQRLVVAKRGEVAHRDRINTDSSISRDRFSKRLAGKLGIDLGVLGALIDSQIPALADQADKQAKNVAGNDGEDAPSQATLAANMAADWDLWHTPSKDAYATFPVGSHLETWSIRSKMFKRYLAKQFFEENEKVMNADALGAALNLIEARALFDGEGHVVNVRVAEYDGKIYLDLCNAQWQVVEVASTGWQIIDESPVKFRRSGSMLPLPIPKQGGSVDELRAFLNVDDATWPLVVAWLLAALRPRGPYPVLAMFAEQGSGKSTTGRQVRDLVDPNSAPLRSEPRDGRDMMIAASNSWCIAYDNLSHIAPWLSDALCRLSTGGGFATRELYTDQDEVIFESQRPIMLTSIEEVAHRSDLLDRCLIIWLPHIPQNRRRPEAELMRDFEIARPRILGALLDAVVGALRELPAIKVDSLPRMADFALWVTAAEMALGWAKGTFMEAYAGNRTSANDVALEASVVAKPILDLLDEQKEWVGTSSELLHALEARVSDQIKRQRNWPSNARSISGHLKRLSPNLREAGWEIKFHRDASRRLWSIRRRDDSASPSKLPSLQTECSAMQTNANQWNQFPNDAHDANDAISETTSADQERHCENWEEGEF